MAIESRQTRFIRQLSSAKEGDTVVVPRDERDLLVVGPFNVPAGVVLAVEGGPEHGGNGEPRRATSAAFAFTDYRLAQKVAG